jgi:putative LysE/RhtB family amino acid efflux pump
MTSLAGTASNPLTIASWAAVFAAASTAGAARTTAAAALLVAGVACGSFTSVSVLASGVAILGRALGDRLMRVAEIAAGLGLLGFGTALGYRTLHDRS